MSGQEELSFFRSRDQQEFPLGHQHAHRLEAQHQYRRDAGLPGHRDGAAGGGQKRRVHHPAQQPGIDRQGASKNSRGWSRNP